VCGGEPSENAGTWESGESAKESGQRARGPASCPALMGPPPVGGVKRPAIEQGERLPS